MKQDIMAKFKLQMKLILWKIWRTKLNAYRTTLLELLLPVLFVGLACYLKNEIPDDSTYIKEATYFPREDPTHTLKTLYYAPNNTQTNRIMEVAGQALLGAEGARGVESELQMVQEIDTLLFENKAVPNFSSTVVGVVFNEVPDDILPKRLEYTIRTRASTYDMSSIYSKMNKFKSMEYTYYFTSNFVPVQREVDLAFLKLHESEEFKISHQKMPAPPHWEWNKQIREALDELLAVVIIFSYAVVGSNLLICILEEKSVGMTEIMKISGLREWMIWVGWYIHALIVIIPSLIVIIVLSKRYFFKDSDTFILILFLILYITTLIGYILFMSTLFDSPMMGQNVALILWLMTHLPATYLTDPYAHSTARNAILIFPNSCLFYGMQIMGLFEVEASGLSWRHLYLWHNENFRMGILLLILFIESILFLLLAWYMSQVRPGKYGNKKPWNFCFKPESPFDPGERMPCAHCNPPDKPRRPLPPLDPRDEVESVPGGLQAGIQIRNLHKKFRQTAAVNGLSCDIYVNQITVLLGHNGAGKTTTMNIITGMMPPTRGTILVNGYSIRTQMNHVRESLGFCPQNNVHFKFLTVQEHLMFFAMLRGMTRKEAKTASEEYLTKLGLSGKARNQCKQLSGGMKRRVSLGMSLIGSSKVLILDEPTSGMDPETRREIWDILLQMRESSTILITTHYMEEADALGDRIIIMHSGELVCYGTPMFLKKYYGTGYTLSFLCTPQWNTDKVTSVVRSYVPNATVSNVSVGTVTYSLPTSDTAALTKLLLHLDRNKNELGFSSYGVSLTTMDEVFLKVGKLADEAAVQYNTGFTLTKQQIWALLVKRVNYNRHKWIIFLGIILIPILMQIITLSSSRGPSSGGITLKLWSYPSAISYYSSDVNEMFPDYERAVEQQLGTGIHTYDVSKEIIKVGTSNLGHYLHHLVTAAEMNVTELNITAMYGSYAIHSPAISLNLITNAILMYTLDDSSASITVRSDPLSAVTLEDSKMGSITWCMLIPIGFAFHLGFVLMFYINERVTGVKQLQIMYGVHRIVYWLTNYMFDVFLYICIVFVMVLCVVTFRHHISHSSVIWAYIELLILFGFVLFLFGYFFHYLQSLEKAINILVMLCAVCAIVSFIIIVYKEVNPDIIEKVEKIESVLILFPLYGLCDGLYNVVQHGAKIRNWENSNQVILCMEQPNLPCCVPDSQECYDFYNFYKGEYSLVWGMLSMLINIVLLSVLFLLIDYGYLKKYCNRDKVDSTEHALDSDVVEEKNRVATQINKSAGMASTSDDSDVLLVSNLRKSYGKFAAVNGLNFGVKASECFGLLGINGAGKSTTFKMLSGEIFVTAGNAKILGYFLRKKKRLFTRQIGYCPQTDALNLQLTTNEMITLFTNIRGIPKVDTDRYVYQWIQILGLAKYQDVQTQNLSGGNKRKVCTAIALLGEPPVVMLDEPTSGVDPVARRHMWEILAANRRLGQTIVFTSHSMDECEALCDRLAIMVDGQMKCIGNIHYLKHKFGEGFTLAVKIKFVTTVQSSSDEDRNYFQKQVADLKSTIENEFQCTLKDEHMVMIMYHITDTRLSIGAVFEFMENLKQTNEILDDFTISNSSLEQVFLSFAKEQLEDTEEQKQQKKLRPKKQRRDKTV